MSTNDPPAGPSVSSDPAERPLSFEEQIANLDAITLEQMDLIKNKLYKEDMIKVTPCELTRASNNLNVVLNEINCYMKFETFQYSGSCKARGAAYAVLQHLEKLPHKPIISASMGNFAIALSNYVTQYEIPATIVIPKTTPLRKIVTCGNYQEIKVQGDNLEEAETFARNTALEKDMIYIGEDHPNVIIGQTSVGLEILDHMENVDVIVVPIDSGSLIAGVAMAVKKKKPTTMIIGVESETCPSFSKSREAGKPVTVPVKHSFLTDELAIPKIGINAFSIANTLIDDLITVKEEWIAAAMCQVIEKEGCTIEGSGALGLAAILYGNMKIFQTCKNIKNVVLLLSDGNLDPAIVGKCVELGLYAQKRLLEFTVEISDEPQYLQNLIKKLISLEVSIYKLKYYASSVEIICETLDELHANALEQFLNEGYVGWSGFHPARTLF